MTTSSGARSVDTHRPYQANGYRSALIGIAIVSLGLGAAIWGWGFSQGPGNRYSDPTDGLAQMAVGGNLMGLGVVALLLWLVAAAIIHSLEQGRATSPAVADAGASVPPAGHWLDKGDAKPTE